MGIGRSSLTPMMGDVVEALSSKMIQVAQNPGKPKFNHYMFESISCAVRYTCEATPEAVTAFEEKLFPPSETILTVNETGIVEFQPYVFQILAQMLEAHPMGSVPDSYVALFPMVL